VKAPRRSQVGSSQADNLARNAIATALDVFEQIDNEAKQKKLAHRGALEQAKANALERIEELRQQVSQLDEALAAVDSITQPAPKSKSISPKSARPKPTLPTAAPATTSAKPTRRKALSKWGKVRKRIVEWLKARPGRKFSARDLANAFPDLGKQQVSLFLKPLRDAGTIQTDTSEGVVKTKYYVKA